MGPTVLVCVVCRDALFTLKEIQRWVLMLIEWMMVAYIGVWLSVRHALYVALFSNEKMSEPQLFFM